MFIARVEQVSAADVPKMLDANTKLLDIRTEVGILQGLSFQVTSYKVTDTFLAGSWSAASQQLNPVVCF